MEAYHFLTAEAFRPRINLMNSLGKSTTVDHALITKIGLLKSVIKFLIDNRQYLKTDKVETEYLNGLLAELSDNPNAAKDTIDSISPQIKFINALNEIQSANAEVDSFPLNSSAAAHFDAEQFKQGSQRLNRLRQELITSLLTGDKMQHARNLAGSALHTLQDFYSHSNWIELGNSDLVLAKPGSEIPDEFIAGATEATCKSCLSSDNCETNLITVKLTSGYRSGQDIKKPVNKGKCSHGGKTDSSRLKPATGGINKDSTSKDESPHA
ncbi:Von Willebrand factor A, partial [Desmophyllum pertusum]